MSIFLIFHQQQQNSYQPELNVFVKNPSVNHSNYHKNVLSTAIPVVLSQPSSSGLTHVQLTKVDQVPSDISNITHNNSTEHILDNQVNTYRAANQIKNVPDDVWRDRFNSEDYNACIKTQLNPDKWRSYLSHYWDQQLPDLIQYGFPLDFNRDAKLISAEANHTYAIEYEQHIDQYVAEELKYGALYGPFEHTPIPVMFHYF